MSWLDDIAERKRRQNDDKAQAVRQAQEKWTNYQARLRPVAAYVGRLLEEVGAVLIGPRPFILSSRDCPFEVEFDLRSSYPNPRPTSWILRNRRLSAENIYPAVSISVVLIEDESLEGAFIDFKVYGRITTWLNRAPASKLVAEVSCKGVSERRLRDALKEVGTVMVKVQ